MIIKDHIVLRVKVSYFETASGTQLYEREIDGIYPNQPFEIVNNFNCLSFYISPNQ